MAKLYAPNGALITGTCDVIPACEALINNDGITRNPDGTFEFDYAGGTEVNWDGQVTELNDADQRLFFDENGDTWSEDQLELRDDEVEDAG